MSDLPPTQPAPVYLQLIEDLKADGAPYVEVDIDRVANDWLAVVRNAEGEVAAQCHDATREGALSGLKTAWSVAQSSGMA